MATPNFSCVLDQQADALIQSLVCVSLCVCHMRVGAGRGHKRALDFLELELHVVNCLIWVGDGIHSGPLKEQQVL